ncbi:MAG: class I SAM-dependent rRNA methyltransferase [Planctomycetes bacterium]|nr:class I SAM-dependent rRNA methyltransferase [Planctomycetota bacterium]
MSLVLARVMLDTDLLSAGPWIFGRQVLDDRERPVDGSIVEVYDGSDRFIGHGLYNRRSDIRVRLLTRGKKSDLRNPRDFLLKTLSAADRLRRKTLKLESHTDAYRIAHAEGDDLPGLIVDRLGHVLVCEHHALGFWNLRADVEWALNQLYPGFEVVHRVPTSAAKSEGFEPDEPPRDVGEVRITENEVTIPVKPGVGHKTGYFCDQRDNRLKVARLAEGADVLDMCTNTGGFALQCKRLGARSVRAVDLDEVVLERARKAAEINRLEIEFLHADGFNVFRNVRTQRERPNLIILDPHKLIRGRADDEEGLRRYHDWNTLALEAVRPGGIVATFSCSGALELPAFLGILFQSARRAGRTIRLLETLGAGPDHPQRPDFSRSRYLKGAILAVD